MPEHPPFEGPGLVSRRLRLVDGDVVWLKAILEAHDGLGALYGDGSGIVTLTTTSSRAAELDALLNELSEELDFERLDE